MSNHEPHGDEAGSGAAPVQISSASARPSGNRGGWWLIVLSALAFAGWLMGLLHAEQLWTAGAVPLTLLLVSGAAQILVTLLGGRGLRRTRLDWFIVAYLASLGLSSLLSIDRQVSLRVMEKNVLYVLYFYLAVAVLQHRRILVGAITLVATSIGWLSLESLEGHALEGFANRIDLYPTIPQWSAHPEIGLLLLIGIGLVGGVVLTASPAKGRTPAALLLGLLTVSLLTIYSRAAWVSLVVLVGFFALAEGIAVRRWRTLGLIVPLGGIVLFVAALIEPVRRYGQSIFQPLQTEQIAGRFQHFRIAWRIISHYPWTGSGPGTYVIAYLNYQGPGGTHAHNLVLQLLAETGVFGAATFLAIPCLTLYWLLKEGGSTTTRRAVNLGVAAAIAAVLIRSQADYFFGDLGTSVRLSLLYWTLLAAGIAALPDTRSDHSREAQG